MNGLVTGAAGFIASQLCERLFFHPAHRRFTFVEADVLRLSWHRLLPRGLQMDWNNLRSLYEEE